MISRYKTGKHFAVTITDTTLAVQRQAADRRRGRPGRVLRAPHPGTRRGLDAAAVVTAYKNLKYVEKSKPQCCHSRGSSALSSVPSRSVFMRAA